VRRCLARSRLIVAIVVLAAVAVAVRVEAQFFRNFRSVRIARPADVDGTFQFCRIMFTDNPFGDGGDWSVDWPRADINLSIRLSELTKTTVGRAPTGDPSHLLMRLTDDTIFQCPFLMMTEVGSLYMNEEEAARLRTYLLKGGFLWADDFWGDDAWDVFEEEMSKVFPPSERKIVDLPLTHPLWRTQFEMKDGAPQISAIGNWQRGVLSERGAESAEVHVRAIFDDHDRLMVLITHNTDFGDSYEREGDNPDYFYQMSVPGYAFGINTLLYAMTH
jgi:Domain of unknown function (DUF4159)